MTSEYLKTLLLENRDVGERYLKKLKLINNVDPFTLELQDLNNSIHGVPPVTNMDIVSYLVLTHSYYTKAQMKAYKSSQSFKYFESGFVVNAGTKVENNFYILVGQEPQTYRQDREYRESQMYCMVEVSKDYNRQHYKDEMDYFTCVVTREQILDEDGNVDKTKLIPYLSDTLSPIQLDEAEIDECAVKKESIKETVKHLRKCMDNISRRHYLKLQ